MDILPPLLQEPLQQRETVFLLIINPNRCYRLSQTRFRHSKQQKNPYAQQLQIAFWQSSSHCKVFNRRRRSNHLLNSRKFHPMALSNGTDATAWLDAASWAYILFSRLTMLQETANFRKNLIVIGKWLFQHNYFCRCSFTFIISASSSGTFKKSATDFTSFW